MKPVFSTIILTLLLLSTAQADTPGELLARAKALKQGGVLMEATSVYEDYLKEEPNDADARMELVEILLSLDRFEQALPHIQKLRAQKPDNPRVKDWAGKADNYKAQVRDGKLRDYEYRLKQPNASPDLYLEFANFLIDNGYESRGMEMFVRYLEKQPNDDAARLDLAQRYAWRKQYSASGREITIILNRNEHNVEARVLLGDILYWQGDEYRAVEQYRRALRDRPNHHEAKKNLERIVNSPDYQEKQLKAAVQSNPQGPSLNALAEFYVKQDRVWEADSLVKIRQRAAPNDADAKSLADKIDQIFQARLEKQVRANEDILLSSPDDKKALLFLGRYYSQIGKYKKSLEYYNRYYSKNPMDYNARMERAKVLSWSGRTEEATEEFRILTVVLTDNPDANLSLAEALLVSGIKLEEAESIFAKELKRNPKSLRAKEGYAESLRRQGEYLEAEQYYREILVQDSTNETAREGLKLLESDISPLILKLEKYMQENPNDESARRRLAGLFFDAKRYYEAEQQVLILLEIHPHDEQLKSFLREIGQRRQSAQSAKLIETKHYLQQNPDDLDTRIEYARELAGEGFTEEALAQMRLILEKKSSDEKLLVEFAELLINNKQLKEAADIYERLADSHSANAQYRYKFGLILSWMGDNDRAIAELERALRLKPDSIEIRLAISDAYRWKGDNYAAYDAYNRVLAVDPQNSKARRAIREINGPFFRGLQGAARRLEDSENFKMTESSLGAIVNFSLKMQLKVGLGNIYFEQSYLKKYNLYSERGWFWFGNIDYDFDMLTHIGGELRFYIYQKRKTDAYRIWVTHDFKDVPDLRGLFGQVEYSFQDAVLDVASTRGLGAWTSELDCEKLSAYGRYNYSEKYVFSGQASFLSISDDNSRTDLWVSAGYKLRPSLTLSLRYDNVSAKDEVPAYWSPRSYETIQGIANLSNTLSRFSYTLEGGVGRVLKTNDSIRQLRVEIQFRISPKIQAGANYSSLKTTRRDGQYNYQGLAGSLTLSL
ncbi:MAG: tetratricopeptide repeat protein [Calditrichota bacterium]